MSDSAARVTSIETSSEYSTRTGAASDDSGVVVTLQFPRKGQADGLGSKFVEGDGEHLLSVESVSEGDKVLVWFEKDLQKDAINKILEERGILTYNALG